MIGQQLGPYRIQSELGTGGMGRVYLADNGQEGLPAEAPKERRRVALKVLHPHVLESSDALERFQREAEIGRRVRHENVVRTLDVGSAVVEGATHHYLVMEYVEGQTLRGLLDELGTVPEELCRHIGREVAKGLEAIHDAGVVHRDLKPENVLITAEHVVKVMDLGVAHLQDAAFKLSQTGAFLGSVLYAAPEQFLGKTPDARADYYSLGLVLYELATGRAVFAGDNLPMIVHSRLHETPRPVAELNPQLSPFFEEVVAALLLRDPQDRLDFLPEEESAWWRDRARQIRAATRRPLRRIRIPRETSLHGRDGELDRLRSLYRRASDGEGQVLLIEGEAGIGKTRLVDELIGHLQSDGEDLNFLFGGYPPGGAATAAGAWSTAYREQFGSENLAQTLAEYLTVTPSLVPAAAALLRGEPPPAGSEPLTKDSIQTVFVHATRALAAERPTVVLIEDLHFAPEEGRALLAALALAVPEHRILLIATTRPGLSKEWVSNLDRLEHVRQMTLGRLGPRDVGALLIDAFRSERLAEELALPIATKSDGNPFFVFEIIRGLREDERIAQRDDGSWVSTQAIREIQIPSSVRELVEARIAELDDAQRELLDVAACCGFEFDPLLVGDVLGLADIPLLRRLGRLENPHRIVRSAGMRYVFDHHQVQEALYEAQSGLLRQRYHAAIGEALERRAGDATDGATAVELCEQFLKGGRGEPALRYLDGALEHLTSCYRNDQAAGLAKRALEIPGLLGGTRRAEVLLSLAARVHRLRRPEEEEAALKEALALAEEDGDPRLRARAHLAVGVFRTSVARFEAATEALELARDLAQGSGDRKTEMQAVGNLGNLCLYLGRSEEGRQQIQLVLDLARESGDRMSEGIALSNLGTLLWSLGRYEEAQERLRASLAIADELGDRVGVGRTTGFFGLLLSDLGRFEEAREHEERAITICREAGDRSGEASALVNLGSAVLALGRYRAALEYFSLFHAISKETGERGGEAIALVNLGALHASLGAFEIAKDRLHEALADLREFGSRRPEGYALHGLAVVAEAEGNLQEAKRYLAEALAVRREIDYRNGIAVSLAALGRVLLSEGNDDEAKPHLEEALEIARELRIPGPLVLASALLPDVDAGLAAFAEHESLLRHVEKMEARFLLWKATRDPVHLEEARRLLGALRDHAPEDCRDSMIENVPLHREIGCAGNEADRRGASS